MLFQFGTSADIKDAPEFYAHKNRPQESRLALNNSGYTEAAFKNGSSSGSGSLIWAIVIIVSILVCMTIGAILLLLWKSRSKTSGSNHGSNRGAQCESKRSSSVIPTATSSTSTGA